MANSLDIVAMQSAHLRLFTSGAVFHLSAVLCSVLAVLEFLEDEQPAKLAGQYAGTAAEVFAGIGMLLWAGSLVAFVREQLR